MSIERSTARPHMGPPTLPNNQNKGRGDAGGLFLRSSAENYRTKDRPYGYRGDEALPYSNCSGHRGCSARHPTTMKSAHDNTHRTVVLYYRAVVAPNATAGSGTALRISRVFHKTKPWPRETCSMRDSRRGSMAWPAVQHRTRSCHQHYNPDFAHHILCSAAERELRSP